MIGNLPSYIFWAIPNALLGVLVAAALNKWVRGWRFAKRVSVGVSASLLTSVGIAGSLFLADPGLSIWFSPDEFLFPFLFQIGVILLISTPAVWLVSRRVDRTPLLTDVFE